MTYHEALEQIKPLREASKKYWADKWNYTMQQIDDLRKNEDIPPQGYSIVWRSCTVEENDDISKITIIYPGVLAGDGRMRDKKGNLIYLSSQQLEEPDYKIVPQWYYEW